MTTSNIEHPRVVSPVEWLAARKELLAKEKQLTRQQTRSAPSAAKLPLGQGRKEYLFDGPDGEETLSGLFAGRSQLIVYHFMFGPDWEEGCPELFILPDHFDGAFVIWRIAT